jgi:Domain of unknown function (DUF5606)
MELLSEVAHISGKPGLYRILKPGRAGVIVETLDDKKAREIVNSNARVSILKDISIYTEDPNKSTALGDLFLKIRELNGEKVEMDVKNASRNQLTDFMTAIMPDFDRERVHDSDIRKIINWYNTVSANLPEVFEPQKEEDVEATAEVAE